jgi:hypothetical protein
VEVRSSEGLGSATVNEGTVAPEPKNSAAADCLLFSETQELLRLHGDGQTLKSYEGAGTTD